MKKDYEIKFWKQWLEADHLKRLELVKKLAIIREALTINQFPKKHQEKILANALNGYFEDLENAIRTKNRLEKNKKIIF